MGLGRTGHLLLPLEAGVRQSVTYASDVGTVASTKVYSDWTFLNYKKLDLFAGANIGASYGNTPFRWSMAPEAGLRFWLKNDVAVVGRVEYPFGINVDGVEHKRTLSYCIGLQMKF
jgi:hypothetical protein